MTPRENSDDLEQPVVGTDTSADRVEAQAFSLQLVCEIFYPEVTHQPLIPPFLHYFTIKSSGMGYPTLLSRAFLLLARFWRSRPLPIDVIPQQKVKSLGSTGVPRRKLN